MLCYIMLYYISENWSIYFSVQSKILTSQWFLVRQIMSNLIMSVSINI